MKNFTTRFLPLLLLFPLTTFAQGGKWLKQQEVWIATTVNVYPQTTTYTYLKEFSRTSDQLLLTFLRGNSGTFVIEEGDELFFADELAVEPPTQVVGAGANVQFVNARSRFHEIGWSKLSVQRSSFQQTILVTGSQGDATLRYGYAQRTAALALRYAYGRYFGDAKRSSLRFGLALAVEPSLYSFTRTSYGPDDFPYRARVLAIDVAAIPLITAKLSKRARLDVKAIPNLLLADFGGLRQKNPLLTVDQQLATRDYDPPQLNMAYQLAFRYQIQEAKRKGRR